MNFYTNYTFMKQIDYSDPNKKELIRLLLDHHPQMVSYVYNYDFELLKPLIDQTTSIINSLNALNTTDEELAKIISYAYKKHKGSKHHLGYVVLKQFTYIERLELHNYNIYEEFRQFNDIKLSTFQYLKEDAKDFVQRYPVSIFYFNPKVMEKLILEVGLEPEEYFNSIDYNNLFERIRKYDNGSSRYSKALENAKESIAGAMSYWRIRSLRRTTNEKDYSFDEEMNELRKLAEKYNCAGLFNFILQISLTFN